MGYPRYSRYEASGIAWLGDVPAHWAIKRLRFVARLNPSKQEVGALDDETLVSFLPMEAVGDDGTLNLERVRPLADVASGYTYFAEGDVTVAKITPCFENGKGALMRGLINGVGFGTTELTVLRPDAETDARYLYYLTASQPFREQGAGMMYGAGGQKRVPDDFLRDFALAWPSLSEQSTIASFLDRETAKIAALIAKQERLIALLREKRQALITHAVTKGLDADVPMKDSGVAWIGGVPAHWSVRRTRGVARLESGHTPSRQHPEYWENCTVPWISLADVWQLRDGTTEYISETKELISDLGIANSAARLLPTGTVIVSRTASVGFSGIMARPMTTTQDFVNWVCGPLIQPEYLLYVFRTMTPEFRRLIMGSTHQTIYMPEVATFVTPLPPQDEQAEIVEHIRARTAEIDALIGKAQRAILLMREHRTALIAAAVTGQIDVRGAVEHEGAEARLLVGVAR